MPDFHHLISFSYARRKYTDQLKHGHNIIYEEVLNRRKGIGIYTLTNILKKLQL